MKATYEPALRIQGVPLPALDEDAATFAVAAAQALLAAAHVSPGRLHRLVVASRTGTGLGPLVALALGAAPNRVEEVVGELPPAQEPERGAVLRIQTDAPRSLDEAHAQPPGATAELLGGPDGPDLRVAPRPWELPVEAAEKLTRWERDAPPRTSMGAYIPKGTWLRTAAARYRLEGSACEQGHVAFPPRPTCERCGRASKPHPLPRPGQLETFTVIAKGAAPSEFEPLQDLVGEYAVGVATFGGPRVPALFTETPLEALEIGMAVDPVFRRLYAQDGEWRYGTKFRAASARLHHA